MKREDNSMAFAQVHIIEVVVVRAKVITLRYDMLFENSNVVHKLLSSMDM